MATLHRVELKVRRGDQDGLGVFVLRVHTDDEQAAIDKATALARSEGFHVVDAAAKAMDPSASDLWFQWVAPRSFLISALHILAQAPGSLSETALCGSAKKWKVRKPLVYGVEANGQVVIRVIPVTVVCNRCLNAALDLTREFEARHPP